VGVDIVVGVEIGVGVEVDRGAGVLVSGVQAARMVAIKNKRTKGCALLEANFMGSSL
jgi:hypothetical protein